MPVQVLFRMTLLPAGPAGVNLIGSIPFGHWLEGRPLVRTSYRAAIWTRAGYLGLIALPALLAPAGQIWTLIALTLIMSVPGTLLAISFNALFADLVPPELRAQVVGRRNALLAVTLTITALVCGGLLDSVRFPVHYQWVFAMGALGAALSSY